MQANHGSVSYNPNDMQNSISQSSILSAYAMVLNTDIVRNCRSDGS